MMVRLGLTYAGLTAALLFSAPAKGGTPLQPTGPWTVDFAETQCNASRNYGSAEKPLYLVLKRSVLEGTTQLLVIQSAHGGPAIENEVVLAGGPGAPIRIKALDYGVEKTNRRVRSMTMDASQMRWFASAPRIDITSRKSANYNSQKFADYHFALQKVPAIQEKLDECMANLVDHWNVSPQGRARVATGAQANLAVLFNDDDYPGQALFESNSGKVAVRLLVDPSGGSPTVRSGKRAAAPHLISRPAQF